MFNNLTVLTNKSIASKINTFVGMKSSNMFLEKAKKKHAVRSGLLDYVPGYPDGPKPSNAETLSLHWCHDGRDDVSNHRCPDCLLNRLFRRRSTTKTLKRRVTGLCEGNLPVISGLPSQRTNNAENVSIWWCHHDHGTNSLLRLGIFRCWK